MPRRDLLHLRVPAFLLASLLVLAGSVSSSAAGPPPKRLVVAPRAPLSFEPNQGQAGSRVKFLSRGSRYTLFLHSNETLLRLKQSDIRVKFRGANPKAEVIGAELLPGRSNYFRGSDASQWRTNVPHYARVVTQDIYPGIDLIHYGNNGHLEFDFVVQPGANPRAIQLAVQGAKPLRLNDAGDLVVATPSGDVLLHAPVIYQDHESTRQTIAGGFVLLGKNRIAFRLGPYDSSLPLVIDPVFSFATYLGGTEIDVAIRVATDGSGNLYAVGGTCSSGFPTANAMQGSYGGGTAPCEEPDAGDAFVTKFNPDGTTLLYSTFLGGSDEDIAFGIAVDSSGNAYITGKTRSTNFPHTTGAFQETYGGNESDAFVTKLDGSGSLVYSTYLGGSNTDEPGSIAFDSNGNAYVAGETRSTDFPTTQGAFQTMCDGCGMSSHDAFLTKLNATGTDLVYSTFLGASDDDRAHGVAVDSSGNAYVAGETTSNDFPTQSPIQANYGGAGDSWVAKIKPDGSDLLYSTYLGGTAEESHELMTNIVVDASGNAYVAGQTASSNFPFTMGAYQTTFGGGDAICPDSFDGCGDAYIVKLNPDGSALLYATFLGGSGNDGAPTIALDSNGNAYVAGITSSNNFPTQNPIQANYGGGTCGDMMNPRPCTDAFISKLSADGTALLFSTYLGGTKDDGVIGIAVDSAESVYVAGGTNSADFPTVQPYQDTLMGGFDSGQLSGGFDAMLARIPGPPAVNMGGVVGSADYGADLPGGGIGALFGLNVGPRTEVAGMVPLPTTLADTTVTITGMGAGGMSILQGPVEAPLFFVSPLQINFQMPWEVQDDTQIEITVTVGGTTSNTLAIPLASLGPAIYSVSQQGNGQGSILIANTPTFAAPMGSIPGANSQPAVPGVDFLEIYCTGLGRVTNQPASGAPAPTNPLATTIATPMVTIGGVQANVLFSGLAPPFVGLYVITLQVPANAPTGPAVPVQLTVNGVMSNTVTIAVQ